MPKNVRTPKVIADPIYGIVDIRPVLPMVETPAFQALGDKRKATRLRATRFITISAIRRFPT